MKVLALAYLTMAQTKLTAKMTAPKRKLSDTDSGSDAPASNTKPVKRARKSSQVSETRTYTAEELAELSHDELIHHILSLQSRLEAANAYTAPTSKSSAPARFELSKEDLAKKVTQLRSLMERQIRKAMTWKPSCKTGGATFSQDFLVPAEEVVREVFRHVVSEKDAKKGWKMKKFGVEEFEVRVGDTRASMANGWLTLLGCN